MCKYALALMILSVANASEITQATATSNGYALTMQATGFDTAGEFVQANFNPGDIAYVPGCSCPSGGSIQVIEAWDGIGLAVINGVSYVGAEGGFTRIDGELPSIGSYVAGTPITVSFPITWSVDLFFFQSSIGIVSSQPMFELIGSGSGMAFADLTVLQGQGPAYYSGDSFRYVSAVPEPSTLILLVVGLLAVGWRKYA